MVTLRDHLLCDAARFREFRSRFAINLCRPLSVGQAIGASVLPFLDLSYRKNAEIQLAGRLQRGAIRNGGVPPFELPVWHHDIIAGRQYGVKCLQRSVVGRLEQLWRRPSKNTL